MGKTVDCKINYLKCCNNLTLFEAVLSNICDLFICSDITYPYKTLVKMAICGPKLSLAGCIISAWGIVQLSLMGIFFWIHSVALVEDLNIDEEKISSKGEFVNAMEAS